MSQLDDIIAGSLSVFASPLFADDATLYPQAGASYTLPVVKEDGERLPETVPSQLEIRWARLADCPVKPQSRDILEQAGATYTIHSVREDGTGGIYLFLDKQ